MRVFDLLDVLQLSRRLAAVNALDLGSGPSPVAGYHGMDVCGASERVTLFDVANGIPWPFRDGQIARLYSSHFIEHIPASDVSAGEFVCGIPLRRSPTPCADGRVTGRQDALCWFMNEAYRVAAPGAEFILRWPSLVHEPTGNLHVLPFVDPTHRRFIPRAQLDLYFNRAGRRSLGVEQYPLSCDWVPEKLSQNMLGTVGFEYEYLLRKPLVSDAP